ncbi:adenosylmethionine decarboxylase [Bacillus songklensis]|uniref:S-adenosylmethionine decarboxylase proenzyme n=1 Tax=Bacillus songklensis TaxID=1069116 RepID=A0ABV8B3Q6_9BACI
MDIEGRHIIIDAFYCNPSLLNDRFFLERLLIKAAAAANMEILYSYFHQFQPYGVTGMLILSTSHLSIHTWPERAYASLDFYTCGTTDPIFQVEYLLEKLESKKATVYPIERGIEKTQTIFLKTYHYLKGENEE